MKRTLFACVICLLVALPATADLTALQNMFDSRTIGPIANDSSINVYTDALSEGTDAVWHNTAAGSVATLIIEVAGYAGSNTFGIYDPFSTESLAIFTGAAGAGASQTVYIGSDGKIWRGSMYDASWNIRTPDADFAGTQFGYYIDATLGNNNVNAIFYSDTAKNSDGKDHMLAYRGEGDTFDLPSPLGQGELGDSYYFLAWEDVLGGGDLDYDDMVILVESVTTPVPAAVLLGMLGLGAAGLRLRKRA